MAYTNPGVYIEEVSSGVKPIEGAGTSTAAFIGQTEEGPTEPTLIFKWADYENQFGGIQNLEDDPDPMGLAVYTFFLNGGGAAYIVNVSDDARTYYLAAFESLKKIRDINIVCLPGKTYGSDADKGIIGDAVSHVKAMKNRMVIVDLASDTTLASKTDATDLSLPSSEFSVTYYPWLEVANPFYKPRDEEAEDRVEEAKEDVKAAKLKVQEAEAKVKKAKEKVEEAKEKVENAGEDPALLEEANKELDDAEDELDEAKDELDEAKKELREARNALPTLPPTFKIAPSSFVAGMWAKIDGRRGVWKAPAGVETSLLGVAGLAETIDDNLQGQLNPVGINCIRKIPGAGPVIWGSRTLSTMADPEWRYVPVRRTASMIEESIYNNIQWAVFEPNDHRLWSSLRVNIDAFMNGLWRAGAFQGEKASDAYFVRCNLGDTMEQADIDAGQVIVEVGFAPLKPAEFVIVRIQQKVAQQ